MVRMYRINRHGVHQVRKGHRWFKPLSSRVNPDKLRQWREAAGKRKHEKDERQKEE